jgi:hypothetical protein
MKKQSPMDLKREQIIEAMLAKGWRPNVKYIGNDNLDTILTGKYGSYYFWISADERFAVTFKKVVMTVHDATRQYCKVLSMKLNEVEIKPDYIKCGAVGLFL